MKKILPFLMCLSLGGVVLGVDDNDLEPQDTPQEEEADAPQQPETPQNTSSVAGFTAARYQGLAGAQLICNGSILQLAIERGDKVLFLQFKGVFFKKNYLK